MCHSWKISLESNYSCVVLINLHSKYTVTLCVTRASQVQTWKRVGPHDNCDFSQGPHFFCTFDRFVPQWIDFLINFTRHNASALFDLMQNKYPPPALSCASLQHPLSQRAFIQYLKDIQIIF